MIVSYADYGKETITETIMSMYNDEHIKIGIQKKADRWGITESLMALLVAEHLVKHKTDFIS